MTLPRKHKGTALILVLWLVAALSLVVLASAHGIRQQTRQTMEGVSWQLWKPINLVAERHDQRRQLNAAADKFWCILKGRDFPSLIQRDGTDRPSPESNLRNHDPSPQVHLFDAAVGVF